MVKYLIWCFSDTRKEYKTFSEQEAEEIYADAKNSGRYSSVVLRKEGRLRGYAIKSWSEKDGEVWHR